MRPVLVTALLLLASGCGKDNDLSGSVSELFPLTFNRVELYRNSEALQVSYYNNRGAEVDLVVRLSIAVGDLTLRNGDSYELAGEYAPGHPRTSVLHLAGGEPARLLPPVKDGDLELLSGAGVDEPLRGNFSMSFQQNGEYGSGRTLAGSFSAPFAHDAAFDPCALPPCPPSPE